MAALMTTRMQAAMFSLFGAEQAWSADMLVLTLYSHFHIASACAEPHYGCMTGWSRPVHSILVLSLHGWATAASGPPAEYTIKFDVSTYAYARGNGS